MGSGILGSAAFGGISAAINNAAIQKIENSCKKINLEDIGTAFITGASVGGIGGAGAKIGTNIIKIPDEIIVGQPTINYGAAGGLIGETFGTILTNENK